MKEIIAYPGEHKNKEAIYLSPLCFYNENNIQNFNFMNLNLSKSSCELKQIEIGKFIDQNLNSLVKYTFPKTYNYFPLIYWRRILFLQIFYYASLIFKIENLFDEIITKEDSLKIKVLDDKEIYPLKGHPLSPIDIDGFELFKITSLILKNKKYRKLKLLTFSKSKKEINYLSKTKNSLIKESLFKILESLVQNVKTGYGINFSDAIILKFSLLFLKIEKQKTKQKIVKKSSNKINWRIKLISDLIPINFKSIIIEHIENLDSKPYFLKNKIKLVQNSIWFDFKEIVQSNIGSMNGQIIIPSQHGGDLYSNNEFFKKKTERSYDYFISWKKCIPDDEKNILSLPSPLFSNLFNSYKKQNDKTILVSTRALKFNIGFDGWFINSKENFHYRNSTQKLIKYLFNKEKNNFSYRPYLASSNNALKDFEFFKSRFENLNIIKSNLHKEIKHCKLLIIDHPGTTLSIAFSMNTPFLIYIEDLNCFSLDNNSPMIEEFIEHKILFKNLNDFMIHYNKLIENPLKWWKSSRIQKLRATFLEKYGLIDTNWLKVWTQKLKKV